jgi:hypothetical protein
VTEHDDQIDAALEFAKFRARRFDDVENSQPSANMGLVPLGDLGRRDPDHAHFEPLRRSGLVEEGALDHDGRRKEGRAAAFAHIAADDRKSGLLVSAPERLEAIVEIVVPERRGVIVQRIHGGYDGVNRLRVCNDRLGREIAERRPLKTVAVVEQKAALRLSAGLSDQRRGAREADRIVRAIAIIVVRIEVGVEVGEPEKAQAKPGPARVSWEVRWSLRQGSSFVTGSRSGDEWIIALPGVPVKAAL